MRVVTGPIDVWWRAAFRLGLVVLSVVVATGCAAPTSRGARLAEATATPSSGVNLSDADVWLSFEDDTVAYDGSRQFPDAAGGPSAGRVVTANGGKVERVTGAGGSKKAVAFPDRCRATNGCPRAMIEISPDPALDPGENDFEYGATVWLEPDQTTSGSNIMQKGRFGTQGGQWKLQVDSAAGEPSCVVRSGADALVVRSSVSIADAGWHQVTCRRTGQGISIRVDDTVDMARGRTGSVDNPWPIRVGSPGVGDRDDQFHGSVDDVFLRIAPVTLAAPPSRTPGAPRMLARSRQ